MMAFASRIARPSSPVRSRHSLATFAQSSFSAHVVALCVCRSASFEVHGRSPQVLLPHIGAAAGEFFVVRLSTSSETVVTVLGDRFESALCRRYAKRDTGYHHPSSRSLGSPQAKRPNRHALPP